ncbi:MAG: glycosyltransferase family 4 protein [Deltaproteobacteria bacterium]|nr:glycosyltransferase family 4 protein [Deltaproteobacteria bacterium]
MTLLLPEPPPGHLPSPSGPRVEHYPPASWTNVPRGLWASLVQRLPWQNALFHQPALADKLRLLAPQADLVLLQLARLAGYESALSGTPFAVDLIDSLALNFERRSELEKWCLRPLFQQEAGRLRRCESRLINRAQGVLVVCQRDRQSMLAAGVSRDADRVKVLPLAFPLGGAPAEVRASSDSEEPQDFSQQTLVLTGNLGYFPTVDGFCWWLQEVWPRLHDRRPDLRVLAAGSRPARRLRRAIREAPGFVELIASPPDLRAVLEQGTVAMAPMRSGSGQPLKILEAWEAGIPVVASPWAAAGTAGQGNGALFVADEPAEWAELLLDLLDDAQKRAQMVAQGRLQLSESYDREKLQQGWRDWALSLLP